MSLSLEPRSHDREILRLALPSLGELASEPVYVLVDTAIVGHLGTLQLAGVAVAATTFLSGFSLLIVLAYGTTAAVARAFGAGDRREAATLAVQALYVAIALGVVLGLVGLVLAEPILGTLGAEPATLPFASTYFRISLLGAPALLVMLVGTGYLRGLQNAVVPLAVALATNVVNLLVELWLVFGLDLGVAGSAWSTVFVQWGAATFYSMAIAKGARSESAVIAPDLARIRRYAATSGALFIRTLALRVAIAVTIVVSSAVGTATLAATQIAGQVAALLALAIDSIAIAGQALVGKYLGARSVDGARTVTKRMLLWGVVAGLGFMAVVVSTSAWLPTLFTDDPVVAGQASTALRIVGLLQPVLAIVFVLDGVLIGAGDNWFLAIAMSIATALYLPVALSVVPLGLGIAGVWAAYSVLSLARLLANGSRWMSGRWLPVTA